MINITKGNKNKTIINRDNKNIEIYTLNNSIYLSKKNIAIFFDTKKSQIKSIINKENINYYDSKK
ncbi:MAG: hypothetical protein P1U46_03035 [Patescibacteria group bacterium]|nr:hypothetical protein [Patescibacteria group bacterium]